MNKKDLNIKKLLASVSQDSRGAFDLFYNLYYEQVFRYAYYFLQDKESCREVVVNIFFSVWQSRAKLREVVNIETYLYVVTRNEAQRYLRKQPEFISLPLQEIPASQERDTTFSPEENMLSDELMMILKRAIRNLPEKCRVIFLMAREDGLKTKQIAEILYLQESTVRVQMKIAIEKLTEEIRNHYPDITFILFFIFLFSYS